MKVEDSRLEVIDRLVEYVAKQLPQDEAPLVKNFVRQYYLSVSAQDLASRSILDLYGAVLSHWHYIYQRASGEAKVRAFNPELEKDGWQSAHTIIQIVFDDVPFLINSINMVLSRLSLSVHLIIHMGNLKLVRNSEGKVLQVLDGNATDPNLKAESAIYIEIDKQTQPEMLASIEKEMIEVLFDVHKVVEDWALMKDKINHILQNLQEVPYSFIDKTELDETTHFLKWLMDDHFTFLGYQEYRLIGEAEKIAYESVVDSYLGVLKLKNKSIESCLLSELPTSVQELMLSKQLLIIGKTNMRSTVHRPAYMDFISIKLFNEEGKVIGEQRFVGLYTAVAYNSSPKQIPFLRKKVNQVLSLAGFVPKSHDGRTLLNILETLPRDDLIQATKDELFELSTAILHLQERQRIRLFVREDVFKFFVSCLVFVPRDKFTSALGETMKSILLQAFNGLEVAMTTRFSESTLARIHFVVRIDQKKALAYDVRALESKLIEAGRTWQDRLSDALIEHFGEKPGNDLLKRFQLAFPAGYQEMFSALTAVRDIQYFETLSKETPLNMSLYNSPKEPNEIVRFKLFRMGTTIPLSDVVPILENMGLRIISERPYEVRPKGASESIWINDYRMLYKQEEEFKIEVVKENFQEAFDHIWNGKAENDGFNRLVLSAKLNWREIMVLRAYAKYLWQIGFTFSQDYIENTFSANPEVAVMLIDLFKLRFDPKQSVSEDQQLIQVQKIEKALEKVTNLNEDRILRRYVYTILATIRTNYYQTDKDGHYKDYVAFKLHSAKVPELPRPIPLYEIFGYSPRVEYIHLRAAKVARGGIRWSDRHEDFRTEILGLMKTQQVKNAVIVPMGAKGGFVVKKMPVQGTYEQVMKEVIYCYQTLIRGLLDLTDNYKGDEVVNPSQVVRYDDNDPYLVVAADKGTATFSDIANAISKEYDFWLDDAFASGGVTGYDHKKMGITARGVWESVKCHFQELGFNPAQQPFTVVGIGDMSGDVFGNGMLLSKQIKLVAAFNHQHIFLDPNPDPEKSFLERQRLFSLPRSSWEDYSSALISTGGGVYSRAAKLITLSSEVKSVLDFHEDKVTPNELIRAILKAPVDLLWNGGIGTYVKASSEANLFVGDRTNDALRINGAELRCQVVGEGGNLGFTQLGRVEQAKLGGHLNTDAIDNSGGVNCSDNEVNIKILLNEIVRIGKLTRQQRDEILAGLQEEVAELVLRNNREQPRAINIAISQAADNLEMHGHLIQDMERIGKLDRALECLPDKKEIAARKSLKQGLTRPEIAVLMAYSKTILKEAVLNSDLPEDPYFHKELERAFPAPLQQKFKEYMPRHRLKREIIVTQISNAVINNMGVSFISRLQDETGMQEADIIRAYVVAREIFKADALYEAIDNLNGKVVSTIQYKMLHEVNRLIRRGTRWFLKNRGAEINISEAINHFSPKVDEISNFLVQFLEGYGHESARLIESLIQANVPKELSHRIGLMSAMFPSLDIIEAATIHNFTVKDVSSVYFAIGQTLKLGLLGDLIKKQEVTDHWEALARANFRDELDRQQCNLTISIICHDPKAIQDVSYLLDKWLDKHRILVTRWKNFIAEIENSVELGFTMFAVLLRELLEMAQLGAYKKLQ